MRGVCGCVCRRVWAGMHMALSFLSAPTRSPRLDTEFPPSLPMPSDHAHTPPARAQVLVETGTNKSRQHSPISSMCRTRKKSRTHIQRPIGKNKRPTAHMPQAQSAWKRKFALAVSPKSIFQTPSSTISAQWKANASSPRTQAAWPEKSLNSGKEPEQRR